MEKYYVYLHVNKINNKVYSGITRQKYLCQRWRNGKGYNHCLLFDRAIKKYGWDNFNHIKLFQNMPKEVAQQIERLLIKRYKSKNRSYNIGEGGEGTNSFSEETIQKLKSYTGERASQYGKKKSTDEKVKMRMVTKKIWDSYSPEQKKHRLRGLVPLKPGKDNIFYGKKLSKEEIQRLSEINKIKINCYDLFGNFLKTYNSVGEAAISLGISDKHIGSCASGKRKTTGGFQWRYYNEDSSNINSIYTKYIVLLDNNGNEIKQFKSVSDAAKYVGKSYSCVKDILDNRTINPYSGLKFIYKEINNE